MPPPLPGSRPAQATPEPSLSPPAPSVPDTAGPRLTAERIGRGRVPKRASILRRAVLGILVMTLVVLASAWLLYASIDPAEEDHITTSDGRQTLADVKSWGYQLQGLDVGEAAKSPMDLLVVDETIDGSRHPAVVHRHVERLQHKPTGGRRLLLAYLSIGEAESYRSYWQASWVVPVPENAVVRQLAALPTIGVAPARASIRYSAPLRRKPLLDPAADAPPWLGPENEEWRGNFRVRFWHPDWQGLLFGGPSAALDRILAAGFDGVYLDRADVYGLWKKEQPTAKTDMIRLIEAMAAYGRQKRPGFLVVMQNAEELLATPHLRSSLDAVAKEDLLFGVEGAAQANAQTEVASSLRYLKLARRDGLPVLVVEYVDQRPMIDAARRRIRAEGFIPYFGPRALNALGPAG